MSVERPFPPEDLEYVRREGQALWQELEGARLFITGATGFFGRWLLESLVLADSRHALNVRVVALSRDPESFLRRAPHLAVPGLRWRKGSVTELSAESFDGERFDGVIHLATEADLRADPASAAAVIADGTRRVLDVATRTGARRFLFTSSGAVYGPQPPGTDLLREDHRGSTADHASPYAIPAQAKRAAELLCFEEARRGGLGAVVARCFTFAGPGLPLNSKFAFGNFIGDALRSGPIVVTGDGTAVRSYLYAADLAVWLWNMLLHGSAGRAYNVGSERPVSILGLAEAISVEFRNAEVRVLRTPVPGSAPDRYVPSTDRARAELGLREGFDLPEIIRRTAAWHSGR